MPRHWTRTAGDDDPRADLRSYLVLH